MLNYEEELKKFKPCLDVDEVEDAIYSRDLTDVIDILKEMMKNDPSRQKLFASPIFCGLSDLVTHTSYIDLFLIDKNCIMRYNYNVIVKLG